MSFALLFSFLLVIALSVPLSPLWRLYRYGPPVIVPSYHDLFAYPVWLILIAHPFPQVIGGDVFSAAVTILMISPLLLFLAFGHGGFWRSYSVYGVTQEILIDSILLIVREVDEAPEILQPSINLSGLQLPEKILFDHKQKQIIFSKHWTDNPSSVRFSLHGNFRANEYSNFLKSIENQISNKLSLDESLRQPVRLPVLIVLVPFLLAVLLNYIFFTRAA